MYLPGKSVTQYTVLLSRYARNLGVQESYDDCPQYENEHHHVYYNTKVTIEGHGVWPTPVSYASLVLARETAAKIAYQALTGTTLPPAPQPCPRVEKSAGDPPQCK